MGTPTSPLNWDDLRFVLAVSRAGSLLAAGRLLGVDHTTVGRRVEAAEEALGLRLFTRTNAGYVPTADAERLLGPIEQIEQGVLRVERGAQAQQGGLEGTVRVTSPETLGTHYLAPRLAAFRLEHPGLTLELVPAGEVLDLSRSEAQLAIRTFRSKTEGLVLREVAVVTYGLYASPGYLRRQPWKAAGDLARHAWLSSPPSAGEIEQRWLQRLAPGAAPSFVSPVSAALLGAARASAGVAILPRYLGDAEPGLRFLDAPDPPTEKLYLTVHKDLRKTPRVRALLDFLVGAMEEDGARFRGRPSDRRPRRS